MCRTNRAAGVLPFPQSAHVGPVGDRTATPFSTAPASVKQKSSAEGGAVCSIAAHSRASEKSRRTRKTGQRLRPVIHIDFYPHQASALNAPKQSFVASNIF
jgi:hypothetical protein